MRKIQYPVERSTKESRIDDSDDDTDDTNNDWITAAKVTKKQDRPKADPRSLHDGFTSKLILSRHEAGVARPRKQS